MHAIQEVPSLGVGSSLQWTKRLFTQHLITAGIDAQFVDGESEEDLFRRFPEKMFPGSTSPQRGLAGVGFF